jgi:hypothetical protein
LGKLPDPARPAIQADGSLSEAFEQVASDKDDLPAAVEPDQSASGQ